MEFIEKCPKGINIDMFDVCRVSSLIDSDIMQALLHKFPEVTLRGSSTAFKKLREKPGMRMVLEWRTDTSCPND